MMTGIREGRWLCKHCGSECRGRDEECNGLDGNSGCGAARASGTRFYLPENTPYVTDEEILADALSGQDWNCDHCDGANKGAIDGYRVVTCAHCGNVRDTADTQAPLKSYAEGAQLTSMLEASAAERNDKLVYTRTRREERIRQRSGARNYQHTAMSRKEVAKKGFALRLWPFLVGPLVIALLVFSYDFFTARHEVTHQVASHHWERSIFHEEFVTLEEEGWSPPDDARIETRRHKIRSYSDVLDHYVTRTREKSREVPSGTQSYKCGVVDLGNGYFQDQTCTRTIYRTEFYTETYQHPVYRKEPNYDTWYSWEVDKWVFDEQYQATGVGLDRHWPEPPALHDRLRESERTERLWLEMASEEHGNFDWDVPEGSWLSIPDGETVIFVTDWSGSILDTLVAEQSEPTVE